MDRLSMDWNCIIEVEECRSQRESILQLVQLHSQKKLEIAPIATSACENLKGSIGLPVSPQKFLDRLRILGWEHLPVVPTVAVYDMTFWDFSFWADDGDDKLISEIWDVIGKKVPMNATIYAEEAGIDPSKPLNSIEYSKWRNVWCDVHSAHAHIKASRDVFITMNTKDFQKHQSELGPLGMPRIETPQSYIETAIKD